MGDLIDRDELLEKMPKDDKLLSYYVRRMIVDAPAVDAAPVVHGRWLDCYDNFETAECDRCKNQFEVTFDGEANGALFDGFKQFYKFCPHCGAKMDGEENAE